MPYYHCTFLDLKPGHVIEPGNWGRIISMAGPRHESYDREKFLEGFRAKLHPDKPSRLNSVFFCDSLETMIRYKEKNTPNGFIYEVEILNSEALIHKTDFNTVEPFGGYNMNEMANFYWDYSMKTNVEGWGDVECSELLTENPIRVVRQITGEELTIKND